jgi:hypothetical protein
MVRVGIRRDAAVMLVWSVELCRYVRCSSFEVYERRKITKEALRFACEMLTRQLMIWNDIVSLRRPSEERDKQAITPSIKKRKENEKDFERTSSERLFSLPNS